MKKKRNKRNDRFWNDFHKIYRIMKLMCLFMLVLLMQVSASTYSQNTKLSLTGRNLTIEQVLDRIEDQTDFSFFYNAKEVDLSKVVNVDMKDQSIGTVLDYLMEGTGLSYTINKKLIIIHDGNKSDSADFDNMAQQNRMVSGKVTDKKNIGLPGVNVILKGTTKGTVTDASGNFSLSVPDKNAVLVFSFVGMKGQEIFIDGKQQVNVTMDEEAIGMEEVVAIGYGTKKRNDITGSISIVDVSALKSVSSRSAEQALQGMAPGVNVITSGVPGDSSKILVRGVTNFGDTDPLVIVDGIEQDLNNISAKDIESIQVLKDAGSASIYGVRGANGVILVTTKKGVKGKPVITYEGSYGMQYPISGNPFNVLNSEDYMKVYNIGFPNNQRFNRGMPDYLYRGPGGAGVAMEGEPEVDPSLYHYDVPNRGENYIIQKVNKEGTDWFHGLFKRAPSTEHNLTVSGGGDYSKYLFGLSYVHQEGTLVNTSLDRYSARVNTEFNLGKHIRVGENINIIYRSTPGFGENSDFGGIIETVKQQPIVPIKDIMGNWGGTFGGPELGDGQNPIAVQYRNLDKDLYNTWFMIGNAFAEVDFFKNITAKTSIGYNISHAFNQDFKGTAVENVQGNNSENSLGVSASYGSTMTFTNTLSYKNTFGKHNLELLVGSEAIEYKGRSVSGSSQKFFSEDFNYLVLGNGTMAITNSSSISSNTLFSLFSRVDYGYNNKYLLGVTVRRDGSSKFGSNERFGIFPSGSLAWRLSEENFMKDISWLDDLKVRASYGILGSQNNVSDVNSYGLFGSGLTSTYYDISGTGNSLQQGFARTRIGNENTGWEKNIVINIGFDVVLLDNALDFSLEYYKKKIEGLLFVEPLPAIIIGGASAPSINIGDIQNTGFDASVVYRGKIANDFNFSVGANLTHYQNKCVNIPDPGYFYSGSHQGVGSMVRNEEGYPVSSFYGYKVIGLFNSTEEVEAAPAQDGAAPGRFRYADTDKNGTITSADRVHLGDPNPDFTYGININLDYKQFDLSAFFYGSQGNEIYNLTRSYLHFFAYYSTTNKSNVLLNAWSTDNTNTTVPVIETTRSFSTTDVSNSYYIENGSFFKMKSLILGYTINSDLIRKINISKLRIYAQIANPFTITKYSGIDPELIGGSTSVMGVDRGSYPNNERNVILGLSVTF